MDSCKDPFDVQALHGKRDSNLANRWLCKRQNSPSADYHLLPDEARLALLYWLSIPFDGVRYSAHHAPVGVLYSKISQCDCRHENKLLGPYCEHATARCNRQGSMNAIHTAVQQRINKCRIEAGIEGNMEVSVNQRSKKRDGDIAFMGRVFDNSTQHPFNRIAVDIQVSCPSSASVAEGSAGASSTSTTRPSLTHSKNTPFIAGEKGFKHKMQATTIDRCNRAGFDFIGFSLETTGALHGKAMSFMDSLARVAAANDACWAYKHPNVLLAQWLNKLSFDIRRAHARTILDRVEYLNLTSVNPRIVQRSRKDLFDDCLLNRTPGGEFAPTPLFSPY
jgi:hypothetical protein